MVVTEMSTAVLFACRGARCVRFVPLAVAIAGGQYYLPSGFDIFWVEAGRKVFAWGFPLRFKNGIDIAESGCTSTQLLLTCVVNALFYWAILGLLSKLFDKLSARVPAGREPPSSMSHVCWAVAGGYCLLFGLLGAVLGPSSTRSYLHVVLKVLLSLTMIVSSLLATRGERLGRLVASSLLLFHLLTHVVKSYPGYFMYCIDEYLLFYLLPAILLLYRGRPGIDNQSATPLIG